MRGTLSEEVVRSIERELGRLRGAQEASREATEERCERIEEDLDRLASRVSKLEYEAAANRGTGWRTWWGSLGLSPRQVLALLALVAMGLTGLLDGAEVKRFVLAILAG